MITVDEQFDSRRITTGDNPGVELRYHIRGTDDDAAAHQALDATAPTSYDPFGTGWVRLQRDSLSVQPVGREWWEGVVRYGPRTPTGESTFAFDTGGATQHVTQSRRTVGAYAAAGSPPDFKGAIGVTADSVEGVDIAVPVYHFSETHYVDDRDVTFAYRAALFRLTGAVNDAAFKGFDAGEVLFLGAAGSRRGYGDWEISFRFAANPNQTNLAVGDIDGIDKKGWEYLWVRYADAADDVAHALIKKPVAVYVEQVYPEGDFDLLGIE